MVWLVYMHKAWGCVAAEGLSACIPPEHNNEYSHSVIEVFKVAVWGLGTRLDCSILAVAIMRYTLYSDYSNISMGTQLFSAVQGLAKMALESGSFLEVEINVDRRGPSLGHGVHNRVGWRHTSDPPNRLQTQDKVATPDRLDPFCLRRRLQSAVNKLLPAAQKFHYVVNL